MIKLQHVSEEHLEGATNLFVKEFNKEPWNDKWEYDRAYNRLKDLYDHPRFIGLVCLLEGQIVGTVMGYLEYWYEGYHYNLKEIFVDTTIQGQGIGTKLLETLEEKLIHEDVISIELFTIRADKTIRFYEKNDFKVIKDLIIMEKNLK